MFLGTAGEKMTLIRLFTFPSGEFSPNDLNYVVPEPAVISLVVLAAMGRVALIRRKRILKPSASR